MDDITPVMQSIVKLEIEIKEEPNFDIDTENEGSQINNVEKDSLFGSLLPKDEEDEEIKPSLSVFIQSNDGNVDKNEEVEESEENILPLSSSFCVKEEGRLIEEDTKRDKREDRKVVVVNIRKEMISSGYGVNNTGSPLAQDENHVIEKQNITFRKKRNAYERLSKSNKGQRCSQSKQSLSDPKNTRVVEKPYQCDVCKKSFQLKRVLMEHIRTHTGEKPYHCEICKKRFSKRGNLLEHMRVHTGERPYRCDTCKKGFSTKGNLLQHMKRHQTPLFQCEICEMSYSRVANISQHMNLHTGGRPYQCDKCQRKFAMKISLSRHMKIHCENKTEWFQCHTCKRTFSKKGHLTQHMNLHTGEKPFQCGICKKKFSLRISLSVHMKTHTEVKSSKVIHAKCVYPSEYFFSNT